MTPPLKQPDGIHTIPVPQGWSIEQAWEHIACGTPLSAGLWLWADWANIEVKDGKMVKVHA